MCTPLLLARSGHQFCEVVLDPIQPFARRISARRLDDGRMISSLLEDMAPFLTREELAENMIADAEQEA